MNLPEKLQKSYQMFHLMVVNKRDGTPHSTVCCCESFEEAIALTRLTWENTNLWDVILGQAPEPEVSNPFKQSILQQDNPFMQSLLKP